MFDGICILLALFLYHKAETGYRNIAFFVLCFFVVSDVVYNYFLLDLRYQPGHGWIIFMLYSFVNCWIIYKLWRLSSPISIRCVLATNVLLNIVASNYFTSNTIPDLVYTMYEYPAGLLMISCLIFLWMVSYGIRLGDKQGNNSNFISAVLRVCLGDVYRVRIKRVER